MRVMDAADGVVVVIVIVPVTVPVACGDVIESPLVPVVLVESDETVVAGGVVDVVVVVPVLPLVVVPADVEVDVPPVVEVDELVGVVVVGVDVDAVVVEAAGADAVVAAGAGEGADVLERAVARASGSTPTSLPSVARPFSGLVVVRRPGAGSSSPAAAMEAR